MGPLGRANDAVHLFMSEVTSRVVADSGIPSDRFHLGKIILQSLKDAPDSIKQIDGAIGVSETNETVLRKSVRCAISMKNYGLQCGDVILIMAPNHLDVVAPFYAALYLGVVIATVDRTFVVGELRTSFDISKPKIIFCQSEKASDVQKALNDLNLDSLVVTFNKGDDLLTSLTEFLERYGDLADTDVEGFMPSNFNAEDHIALLGSTSGTTGYAKYAAITHKNMIVSLPYIMARFTHFPTPTKMALVASPMQWLTAVGHYVFSPILRYTQLQTSGIFTTEHAFHLINTYQPTFLMLSPMMLTTLLNHPNRDQCNFTSLEILYLGGSAVTKELVEEFKKFSPKTVVLNGYGMTEVFGMMFQPDYAKPESPGAPLGILQYRIVNVDTQQDINEPNIPGELWVKGPGVFKEYFNNPEATVEAFAEDRWYKTGDLFYRDEDFYYYFVERIKILMEYNNTRISPVEVENVIRQHSGILEVAVTGVPDPECGDLPVACVVLQKGAKVTADEIKELVKESLSDAKQLRGGVLFLNELPLTPTFKIHRKKLKEMVLTMERL